MTTIANPDSAERDQTTNLFHLGLRDWSPVIALLLSGILIAAVLPTVISLQLSGAKGLQAALSQQKILDETYHLFSNIMLGDLLVALGLGFINLHQASRRSQCLVVRLDNLAWPLHIGISSCLMFLCQI